MVKGRGKCGAYQDPCSKMKNTDACLPSLKQDLCNHIKRVQESSQILKNVLDIATTLVKIMKICGIHECKSDKALDVIIYSFMHFDEVTEHPGGKSKKKIRKEVFYTDLMRDCGMTKAEAKMSYSIVKCAFKAFYHKQVISRYDAKYFDECEWKNAANKTINVFAQSGASKSEVELAGMQILCTYENYVCRLRAKDEYKMQENRNNKCPCTGPPKQRSEYADPCQIPDPSSDVILCGSMQGEFVCPPGYLCPQVICRDPRGRTFLKIDGDKINFDPLIMECEARRAAMGVCSPTFADCQNTCFPGDTDSCDDDISKNESGKAEEEQCDEQDKASNNITKTSNVPEIVGARETVENLPPTHSRRSTARQAERSVAGGSPSKTASSSASTKSKSRKDENDNKNGVFVEIAFSKHKNTSGENMLDVKVHGGCRLDKKLINSLDELEVQYNDGLPILYSCSSKPEMFGRIAGGSNINNFSKHSLFKELIKVASNLNISNSSVYSPTEERVISQSALQKTLPKT